jgi:hypothetical protein
MLNAEELTRNLAGFYGTDQYHKLTIFPGFVGTDGVAYLAKNAECFWLVDEIAIANKTVPAIRNNEALQGMQFWQLNVTGRKAVLVCNEDEGKPVYEKEIEYTDFPLPEIKIWVAAAGDPDGKTFKVMMLPSEY